jgi:hypothetical protein
VKRLVAAMVRKTNNPQAAMALDILGKAVGTGSAEVMVPDLVESSSLDFVVVSFESGF